MFGVCQLALDQISVINHRGISSVSDRPKLSIRSNSKMNFMILITATIAAGLSQGMLLPVLSILLEQKGVSSSLNGLNAAALYIGVGGEEGDMVEDAQKFVEMASEKWINYEFYIAESENHASVIPTTMSRVLRFLKSNE